MTPEQIKLALRERGITRLELSRRTGISYSYLCQMLNGYAPLKEEHAAAIDAIISASPE